MKNIRWYLSIYACAVFIGSCDVIDQEPVSALSQSSFFRNRGDAMAALTGAYDGMQQLVDDMFIYGEVRSDNVKGTYGSRQAAPDLHLFYNQTITPDNSFTQWTQFYAAINRINGVIALVPGIVQKDPEFTQAEANNIVGEALYLRALAYYYLARIWGDVPLILEPSLSGSADFHIPQTSQQVVLEQVLTDLNTVLDNSYLPQAYSSTIQTKGRATVAAAQALLASVHLWMGNYQEAADNAKKVMDNNRYTLVPGSAWYTIFAGEQNSSESIFEFQFNLSQQETNRLFWVTNGLAGGAYLTSPSQETLLLWEKEGDAVRGAGRSYRDSFYPKIFKYEMIVPDDRDVFPTVDLVPIRPNLGVESDGNFIVSRLPDVILMRAEALNRLGQKQAAIDLLNSIRARVGLAGANVVGSNEKLTSSSSMEEIEDAIMHERRLELAFEGHRWFDLVRVALRGRPEYLIDRLMTSDQIEKESGKFGSIDKNIPGVEVIQDPRSWYLPIHRRELQQNFKLVQNQYYQ